MLRLLSSLILCFVVISSGVFAQEEKTISSENLTAEWHKLKSENGEFLIEIPAGYSYFYNQEGFVASQDSNSYPLKEMQLINCYRDRTLMSVEIYRTPDQKEAINAALDFHNVKTRSGKLTITGFVGKEFNIQNNDWTRTTKYVASKTHLYIITAATREPDNPTYQRFLSSVKFGENTDSAVQTILISSLKSTEPEVSFDKPGDNKAGATTPPAAPPMPESDVTKFAVVGTPRVSYTDAARQSGTTGIIRMRLTFSPAGRVGKITILQELPNGLVRQAVLAALRMKYLPQEKSGTPVSVAKVVEFGFRMY